MASSEAVAALLTGLAAIFVVMLTLAGPRVAAALAVVSLGWIVGSVCGWMSGRRMKWRWAVVLGVLDVLIVLAAEPWGYF